MRTLARMFGFTACLLWPLFAHSMTGAVFQSEPGDYIGGGISQSLDTVQVSGGNTSLSFALFNASTPTTRWFAEFIAPKASTFTMGSRFDGAMRVTSISPLAYPGLYVSGDYGCNTVAGWFIVREAVFSTTPGMTKLAIDFKQICDNSTAALYGAIRYNSDIPLVVPQIAAIAKPVHDVLGRDTVSLDGAMSFALGTTSSTSFQWTQLSGTPVNLNGSTTDSADFVAPLEPPGGEDLTFQLKITAGTATDSDQFTVHVASKTDPQTYLYFNSQPGDFVGAGRTFTLTTFDGDITAMAQDGNSAGVSFNGNTHWNLNFAPPASNTFSVGSYKNVSMQDPASPYMHVAGDGRGCTVTTGQYDLLAFDVLPSSQVNQLAIDYEQHCQGAAAALFGRIRYNYRAPNPPTASAGANRTVNPSTVVTLDGTGSSDDKGIVEYHWRQLSGTKVALTNSDTNRASFVAPTVSATETLTFQLLVADSEDLTAASSVSITIAPPTQSSGSSSAASDPATSEGKGGGSMDSMLLIILGSFASYLNRQRVLPRRR